MPNRLTPFAAIAIACMLSMPSFAVARDALRFEQVGDRYDVSISYPVTRNANIDADMERIVWKLTDSFKRVTRRPPRPPHSAHSPGRERAQQPVERQDAVPAADDQRHWMTVSHRVVRPSQVVLSVIFEVETGLQGSHGVATSREVLAVSYDLASGRRLVLDDLFEDDACARAVLAARMDPDAAKAAGGANNRQAGAAQAAPQRQRPAPELPTTLTFWLVPNGLVLMPDANYWQHAAAGSGAAGVMAATTMPPVLPVTDAIPPPPELLAVDVPMEPLKACLPHPAYWDRQR